MITVIGKLVDTAKYVGMKDLNVLCEFAGWTPEFNREWLKCAVERGDEILIVSAQNVSGQFRQELVDLVEILLENTR